MGFDKSSSRLQGSYIGSGIGGQNIGRPFPLHGRVTNVLPTNLVRSLTDIHHIDNLFGVQDPRKANAPLR